MANNFDLALTWDQTSFQGVSTIFTLAQLFFKSSSLNMLVLFSKKLGRGF